MSEHEKYERGGDEDLFGYGQLERIDVRSYGAAEKSVEGTALKTRRGAKPF
jgi:hypothetical protein